MSQDTTTEAPPEAGLHASGRRSYVHVAQRLFNTPLLIDPRKLQSILHAVGDRFDLSIEAPAPGGALDRNAFDPAWGDFNRELWATITDGVAVVEITGTLVHKGAWMGSYSGMTSYDGLSEQLRQLVTRDDVRALLLNIHSGGGEVAGCFDFVDELFALRGQLPIVALAADAACSAAYAIASAADEVVVTQSGEVGSIGVVMTHFDYSKYAKQMGVAVTHIYAGRDKVIGSPYQPLSDADKAKLQGEVDTLYELFVGKVARNRGLDAKAVRDTEAGVFMADAAVKAGLADRIASGREVLDELKARVSLGAASRLSSLSTGVPMSNTQKPNAAAAEASSATAEQLAQARAEGRAEGLAEGTKQASASERARIKGVLTHPEAEGRSELAQHLAFETDLTVEAAGGMLAKAPKQGVSPTSPLAAAMQQLGTPGVRAEEPSQAPAAASINPSAVYAARRSAAN